jgi:hypothetical protein
VRRLLSITLLLIFGLPMVSPLFAMTGGDAGNLPACCRRDGKHHCMMMAGMMMGDAGMGASASSNPGTQPTVAIVTEPCPYGPQGLPGAVHRDWQLDTASAVFAGLSAHPSGSPQAESRRRVSSLRARHKRGPPTISL